MDKRDVDRHVFNAAEDVVEQDRPLEDQRGLRVSRASRRGAIPAAPRRHPL